MIRNTFSKTSLLVVVGMFVSSGLVGCQTQMGGQTLPSAYFLRDDVQFFPAGPEKQLPRTRQALDEYRASGEALEADLDSNL